jgi:Pentacotripeptide-repeat region of PRORP
MNSNHSETKPDPVSSQKRRALSAVEGDGSADHGSNGNKFQKVATGKKRKHHDPLILETRRQIQACCARDDLAHAMEVYREALRSAAQTAEGTVEDRLDKVLEPQTLYNLLSLCCGLSDRGLHIGTPANRTNGTERVSKLAEATQRDSSPEVELVDIETRQEHANTVMEYMRERNVPLTESCFTCMVKLFSKTSVEKAEALLDQAESTQQCGRRRLRLYSPLLLRYCELGQLLSACRVWKRVTSSGLTLSEREYTALMQCSCRTGCGALTERILIEMSEEVRVPSRDFRLAVIDWFRTPPGLSSESSPLNHQAEVLSLLQEIPRPYPFAVETMGPVVNPRATSYLISENCRVDTNGTLQSGCLAGSRLPAIVTPPSLWEELKSMNESIGT